MVIVKVKLGRAYTNMAGARFQRVVLVHDDGRETSHDVLMRAGWDAPERMTTQQAKREALAAATRDSSRVDDADPLCKVS